jgi:quinol-cytochrome oxidoreductase complex cytochrome b subunit
MDDKKFEVIWDWEPPRSMLSLLSFLCLVFYYHKFNKDFAMLIMPLINFLNITLWYEWKFTYGLTFEMLERKTNENANVEIFQIWS